MTRKLLIPVASALGLAAFALSPQPAAASWIAGAATGAQTTQAGLSDVTDIHYRVRRHRRHLSWGVPFAFAPFAFHSGPGWHYQYFGPHKRRCGYRWYYGRQYYTCW